MYAKSSQRRLLQGRILHLYLEKRVGVKAKGVGITTRILMSWIVLDRKLQSTGGRQTFLERELKSRARVRIPPERELKSRAGALLTKWRWMHELSSGHCRCHRMSQLG